MNSVDEHKDDHLYTEKWNENKEDFLEAEKQLKKIVSHLEHLDKDEASHMCLQNVLTQKQYR